MARFMNYSRKLLIHHLGRPTVAAYLQTKVSKPSSVCALAQNGNPFSTNAVQKLPLELNILRLLRNEITYQSEYSPPQQILSNESGFLRLIEKRNLVHPANVFCFYGQKPTVEFNSFTVEDRHSEQWITMKGNYGANETIKIEATMFDGTGMVPKSGNNNNSAEEIVSLHMSLLVDISKGEGCDLEFLCSAWSNHIEIHKVYVFNRDKKLHQPYMGPNFRDLDSKLQNALAEFLKERGVNDELSVFLHEFILNKDRVELNKWLRKIKSFVEK